MQKVEFYEAEDDLNFDFGRVSKDGGKPTSDDVVVMSREIFNSHMETIHLLNSPANAQHLAK